MRRIAIIGGILAAGAIFLFGAALPGLQGSGDKPGKDKAKRPPPTLIRVDLSEEVDGRVNVSHRVQYRTVRMLWFAGLDFKSDRKTYGDKDLKEYKPRKKSDPDFVVKGETKARMDRRPTWYEGVVAYVYVGEADIGIEDSSGKEIARYQLTMERSGKSRDEAIQRTLERLGNYAALAIVECPEIRSRISEKRREAMKKTLAEIRKEVAEFGGTLREVKPRGPSDGEEKEEKGKDKKAKGKQEVRETSPGVHPAR